MFFFYLIMIQTGTIEIGCYPGNIRPNNIYESLFNTALQSESLNENIASKFNEWKSLIDSCTRVFGDFTWEITHEFNEEDKVKVKSIIFPLIKEYYNSGLIRYGGISL